MVDFTKMEDFKRIEVLFRCGRCNEEDWYYGGLPLHMRNGHLKKGSLTKCWGTLIKIEERPVK